MRSFVDRLARRLNWSRHDWSTARDRDFHNAIFAGQTYDPFSASYPGNLTIRRFADLAAAYIHTETLNLDLGCGPGEVTCELARRLPACRFVGVDHSAEAVSRATQLAARLGLTNVSFERQDLERYEPSARVDLVMMFDAFHHMLDPVRFVERIGRATDRFFLIEPAGNRVGQWQKTLDVDWVAEAVFVIRDRLEYQFGLAPTVPDGPTPAPPAGEPTEYRYTMEDFARFFAGCGLEIHGTIAGLERYGSLPHASSTMRDEVGQSVYGLIVELESILRRANLDLAAKHWAIYAERGRTYPARALPKVPHRVVEQPLPGPYEVEYDFHGPDEARAGAELSATVRIVNRSWRVWDSHAVENPILLSYHWLDAQGSVVVADGLRNQLPRPVAPGESATVAFRALCPEQPGRYTLAIDMVHEQVTWFSQSGVPSLRVPMRVV